jgi:hypothetical protein
VGKEEHLHPEGLEGMEVDLRELHQLLGRGAVKGFVTYLLENRQAEASCLGGKAEHYPSCPAAEEIQDLEEREGELGVGQVSVKMNWNANQATHVHQKLQTEVEARQILADHQIRGVQVQIQTHQAEAHHLFRMLL